MRTMTAALFARRLRGVQSRHAALGSLFATPPNKMGITRDLIGSLQHPQYCFLSSGSINDTPAAAAAVAARAAEIYQRHVRLPNLQDVPPDSLKPFLNKNAGTTTPTDPTTTVVENEELALEIRRKRLVYRSKQRGWLEVDLLLGTWAHENVEKLNADALDQFEEFVNLETIDIYNIITLRTDVPKALKRPGGSGVVEQIQEWARSSPLGKADPEQYKEVKNKNKLI